MKKASIESFHFSTYNDSKTKGFYANFSLRSPIRTYGLSLLEVYKTGNHLDESLTE